jgi:hypothetical protein
VYRNFNDSDDALGAIIREYAKERDELLCKIENIEAIHKNQLNHYIDAADMWKQQAEATTKALLKVLDGIGETKKEDTDTAKNIEK